MRPVEGRSDWVKGLLRAVLLGLASCLALAAIGAVIGLARSFPLLRAVIWAEFIGGTLVCAVGALLLLWRPKEAGRMAEREDTANVGFRLFLSGALPFALSLFLSWWLGI